MAESIKIYSQNEILSLLRAAWDESPGESLLELIGSCFAEGDLTHISDAELAENLEVLITLNREHKQRLQDDKLRIAKA